MKQSTPELRALLATNNFIKADLYTFTLKNGTVYRFTSYDVNLTWNGQTYTKGGLLFKRNGTRITTRIEVDILSITVFADANYQFEDIGFLKLAVNGGLDGADVTLHRLFFTDPLSPVGDMWVFSGRVSDIEANRYQAQISVKSDLELLNIQMPRNLYQPACIHTIYDEGCTVVKNGINGTVQSGSSQNTIRTSLVQADGWFNEGVIVFTSGANQGISRTIKSHSNKILYLTLYLPNEIAIGDGFTVYAGCDRTMATCQSKFNNLANFRGYPYLPMPETVR